MNSRHLVWMWSWCLMPRISCIVIAYHNCIFYQIRKKGKWLLIWAVEFTMHFCLLMKFPVHIKKHKSIIKDLIKQENTKCMYGLIQANDELFSHVTVKPFHGKQKPGGPRTSYITYIQRDVRISRSWDICRWDSHTCQRSMCMEKSCNRLLRSRRMMILMINCLTLVRYWQTYRDQIQTCPSSEDQWLIALVNHSWSCLLTFWLWLTMVRHGQTSVAMIKHAQVSWEP